MGLIVLGMHRSGTSVVTRILNMMGAYIGQLDQLVEAQAENPKGFWERRDVIRLNRNLLLAAGADWHLVDRLDVTKIPENAIQAFRQGATKVLAELEAHSPWVLKDPRLCVLFPLWRKLLQAPICILVLRHPIQIAQSLQQRNGFPIAFSLALWERYHIDLLRELADLRLLVVHHEDLLRDPVTFCKDILSRLVALGAQGLRLPSAEIIQEMVDPRLFRQTGDSDLQAEYINLHQQALAISLFNDFPGLLSRAPTLSMSKGGIEQFRLFRQHLDALKTLNKQGSALSITSKPPEASVGDTGQGNKTGCDSATTSQDLDMPRDTPSPWPLPDLRPLMKGIEELSSLAENARRALEIASTLKARLKAVEAELAQLQIRAQKDKESLDKRELEFASTNKLLADCTAQLVGAEKALASAEQTQKVLEAQLQQAQAALAAREKKLQEFQELLEVRNTQIATTENSFAAQGHLLRLSKQEVADLSRQLASIQVTYAAKVEQTLTAERSLATLNELMQAQQAKIAHQRQRLEKILNKLETNYLATRSSARWRVGNSLVRVVEILLLRHKLNRHAFERMADIIAQLKSAHELEAQLPVRLPSTFGENE